MADNSTSHDDRVSRVLTEVQMGRLTPDEAKVELERLAERAEHDKPASPAAKPQKHSLGAGLVILLFGTVFGGVGAIFIYKTISFSHDAGRVEGTIVRHDRTGNKGNKVPIVSYTVDGRPYELRGDIGSNHPPAVHSKVTILYKTADPSDAQIDSFVERWLFPLIFGGIGGIVMLVGLSLTIQALVAKMRSSAMPERFTV